MTRYIQHIFFILLLGVSYTAQSQYNIACTGTVRDAQSGELLIGASIHHVGTNNAVYSNERGIFTIFVQVPSRIECSYVGYASASFTITSNTDTTLTILLASNNIIETVQVVAAQTTKANTSSLTMRELTAIPALGGKPDVLKTAQLLPGIQAQNEGSSLLTIRGGDPGQNLYLIDNVPLIYVNHLGGFTSVFNPDVINALDIYKGSFPSKYGGKLSSILNITQRSGNASTIKGNYTVGLSDLSFTLEGPTKIKNTQFIISGRKTVLPDVFMYAASSISRGNSVKLSYGFHDINAKLTWNKNTYNTFACNVYYGDDYLNYWGKQGLSESFRYTNAWGNKLVSLTWNNTRFTKLHASHIVSYTNYRSATKLKFTIHDSSTVNIRMNDMSSKSQALAQSLWEYTPTSWWRIEFGLQSSFDTYIPDKHYNSLEQQSEPHTSLYGNETALFADNIFRIAQRISFTPGVRIQQNSVESYTSTHIEPRIQLAYKVSPYHTISTHYMQVYQNSHMLFTNGSIMSNEIWIPSDTDIAPSHAKQYSINWNGQFLKSMFATECNVYYKEMANLITFKDGYTSIRGDDQWKQKIATHGVGTSYGLELFIRKQKGDWQGFTGYSYSHTTRTFAQTNQGKTFIFDYDRPHSFSIAILRKFSDTWSISGTWVYQSGLPYTPVLGRQSAIGLNFDKEYVVYESLIYGERNSGRMKPYHRLNLGITHTSTNKHNQRCEWNFSIYNAYNRKNPYYYYYNHDNGSEFYTPNYQDEIGFKPLKMYQISFFPIIPTISYKVYFEGERYRAYTQEKQKNKQDKGPQTFKEKFRAWMFYEN